MAKETTRPRARQLAASEPPRYPWKDAYEGLKRTLNEEANVIEKLVADEDSKKVEETK